MRAWCGVAVVTLVGCVAVEPPECVGVGYDAYPTVPTFHVVNNVTVLPNGRVSVEKLNDANAIFYYKGLYHMMVHEGGATGPTLFLTISCVGFVFKMPSVAVRRTAHGTAPGLAMVLYRSPAVHSDQGPSFSTAPTAHFQMHRQMTFREWASRARPTRRLPSCMTG
eukprot:Hpha_TRINITY_DN10174_c0_g1::TRINITY_DN10174_c0_g1_i1::g.131575::m.131575